MIPEQSQPWHLLSEEFLDGVLRREPAKGHCSRERQTGLESYTHVLKRNDIAAGVKIRNWLSS